MICCLNPYCSEPLNQDDQTICQSCDTPLVPLLRDRFKVIEPIGRGGFGKTYLAEDVDKLNERCIIKQLAYRARDEEEGRKVQELFELEARQLQQLGEHSQIPALFAYFQSNNALFLAQQLIDGQNLLKEFRQDGLFSEAKTRSLLQSLLPVLQYIHDRHVIHRDIKPENIIRQSGTEKLVLIDFGISKVAPPTAQTQTGTIVGSRGYAALEQVKGRSKPSSDLFSLAATAFHMLSGIDPSDLWDEKGYGWVDEWQRYLVYPIEPQFAYILNRLLDKDLKQRYQSADEALRDLQRLPPISGSSYGASRATSAGDSAFRPPSGVKNSAMRSSNAPTSITQTTSLTSSHRSSAKPTVIGKQSVTGKQSFTGKQFSQVTYKQDSEPQSSQKPIMAGVIVTGFVLALGTIVGGFVLLANLITRPGVVTPTQSISSPQVPVTPTQSIPSPQVPVTPVQSSPLPEASPSPTYVQPVEPPPDYSQPVEPPPDGGPRPGYPPPDGGPRPGYPPPGGGPRPGYPPPGGGPRPGYPPPGGGPRPGYPPPGGGPRPGYPPPGGGRPPR